jgi:high-affinity nickel-transport protein
MAVTPSWEARMDALPQEFSALSLLVFVLGLKHGFDADHLAAIDGLTRFNAGSRPRLARFCGVLFSVGHGAVVVAIAIGVATLARGWTVPQWLELSGTWISIGVLTMLGAVNIRAVLRTDPACVVQPVGLRGRFLGRLACASNPFMIALVGTAFALSFDTISQAALFAVTAARIGGWLHALALGVVFMVGMLVTDGINGLWISRLIRRADQMALVASRVMSLVVGGVSLLVAAFGLARVVSPDLAEWCEGRELLFGSGVVGLIAASFLLSLWLTRGEWAAARTTPSC